MSYFIISKGEWVHLYSTVVLKLRKNSICAQHNAYQCGTRWTTDNRKFNKLRFKIWFCFSHVRSWRSEPSRTGTAAQQCHLSIFSWLLCHHCRSQAGGKAKGFLHIWPSFYFGNWMSSSGTSAGISVARTKSYSPHGCKGAWRSKLLFSHPLRERLG